MSNSGTFTCSFADFIRLPNPALRAKRSLSGLIVSAVSAASVNGIGLISDGVGDAALVGGSVGISMSMNTDDWRRIAGLSANKERRVMDGLGGPFIDASLS